MTAAAYVANTLALLLGLRTGQRVGGVNEQIVTYTRMLSEKGRLVHEYVEDVEAGSNAQTHEFAAVA